MTDSAYQNRMSELADLLDGMVTLADEHEDYVLSAKLEDARVAAIKRRDGEAA